MMHRDQAEDEEEGEYQKKNSNILPLWGNEKTMNLNNLVLTNIQSSHYFKVNLFEFKTYHEVIDEIYYNVNHLEPWEKGSRKTGGQTGMCGGVRGVGVGGIVSTAFSCLYKLFTLKLTRKQVNGLLNHTDSPYLRGLGFMYLRYTQPPADLWGWFEPYLEDEEMIDVKAGGGEEMTIGVMVRKMLTKLDWYGTLFPRIPVPIQMKVQKLLKERFPSVGGPQAGDVARAPAAPERPQPRPERAERSTSRDRHRPPQARDIADEIAMEKERIRRERETDSGSRDRRDSRGRDHRDARGRDDRHGSRSRDQRDPPSRDRQSSRSHDHRDGRSRDRRDSRSRDHQDGRSRDHQDGRSRDHQDGRSRDHQDGRSRDRRDSRSRDHQDSRSRDRRDSRSRDHKDGRSRDRHRSRSRSRESRRHRSRSRERRGGRDQKERVRRSRSRSRERRQRSRERERDSQKRHRAGRSASRERRR